MDFNKINDFNRPQESERSAWYLRVSTPKQKLEHQREHVVRFCDNHGIIVPEMMRFEDMEKRHKSAKRQDFQRLLETVKAGQLDWILICSFDRWGVADVDEFFEFRRLLIRHSVQLYSVVDQMNLTGITEGDYFRIVAMAIGATKYVEQMAEKNILKMIEMAKAGWATTGNAPYGLDLVCYPLHDLTHPLFRVVRVRFRHPHLYRILWYSEDSRVERDQDGIILRHHLTVAKEEVSERMPPRDKKLTGYRYEPSVCEERIRAVHLMYELYETEMTFDEVSENLWQQGHKHYDKPFGWHSVECILSNPAYIGLPAWGKIGVGAYRILHNGEPTRVRRKPSDTVYLRKKEEQYIQPLKPVFRPLVPADLWQRIHLRLADRVHTNNAYGKRRTRDRAIHPLNGKLFCPDCHQPMVQGSSMPAQGGRGRKTRCFNCGSYRKTCRKVCFANSVGWDKLDKAVEMMLTIVKDRIDTLTDENHMAGVIQEEWVRRTELGQIVWSLGYYFLMQEGKDHDSMAVDHVMGGVYGLFLYEEEAGQWLRTQLDQHATRDTKTVMNLAFDWYKRTFDDQSKTLRAELGEIERELSNIADALAGGVPSLTVRTRLNTRMGELEARKREIEPKLIPLTARADALLDQLAAIRRTILNVEKMKVSRLLDSFVEKVIPHFEVKLVGKDKKRRTILRSVEFVPRTTAMARNILPVPMELSLAHTDKGSSRRPARSSRERWTN